MRTVLRRGAYRFFFYSADRHEPPHVHVQDGDKLAKLWLEPVLLAGSTGFSPHELTRVQALVAEHREVGVDPRPRGEPRERRSRKVAGGRARCCPRCDQELS